MKLMGRDWPMTEMDGGKQMPLMDTDWTRGLNEENWTPEMDRAKRIAGMDGTKRIAGMDGMKRMDGAKWMQGLGACVPMSWLDKGVQPILPDVEASYPCRQLCVVPFPPQVFA